MTLRVMASAGVFRGLQYGDHNSQVNELGDFHVPVPVVWLVQVGRASYRPDVLSSVGIVGDDQVNNWVCTSEAIQHAQMALTPSTWNPAW
jgi:hypothetical protein